MKVFYSVNGKIGFYDKTTDSPTTSRYKILGVKVWKGKLLHSASPQTFYVDQSTGSDSNNGKTKSSPWKTISRAQYMLQPDDTLIIGPGIYRETLKIQYSALPGHPITFKGTDSKNVIIDGSIPVDMSKVKLFASAPVNIYTTTIQRTPLFLYSETKKLVPAMIPLPYSDLDPFLSTNYITITAATNVTTVSNIVYLQLDDRFRKKADGTSVPDGYWVGAKLYHFIGDGNNPAGTLAKVTFYRTVLSYDSKTNTAGFTNVAISPLDGTAYSGFSFIKNDKYALGNHVGLISKPGQYALDNNQVYVSADTLPKSIEVSVIKYGLWMQFTEYLVFDSLFVRRFEGTGVFCNYCSKTSYLNITSNENFFDGLGIQMGDNIIIDGGEYAYNWNNGIDFFARGSRDCTVKNTYIHHNLNNGIWAGNTNALFDTFNIQIISNRIGPHSSELQHADNIQFSKVHNILIKDNYLINDGTYDGALTHNPQNMWNENCGKITFTGNVIIGGPMGINWSSEIRMYNNVFYNVWLRFLVEG
ncbi:predicted protein [Naegleria gruberi]|uniref:Predicted protein n=1 Tax=Naegleria gruberi TaxID=5762 RepID=D2VLX8_NAEGR|nr:uncharacterized protein NAEGRDRAFT_69936 [Naegleria gruberi]EFC42221.1 predicted protein [Naegleria gruberi]|eukprot:XP_002674965.1 predicted protein [Naegleria gruberi strain NEG-M]